MSYAGSYIKDETLQELRSRMKFVSLPLESHLTKIVDPPAPVPSPLQPKDQEAMDKFGIMSYEMGVLSTHALRLAFDNEMVEQKLRELFQLVKLCGGDEVADALNKYRRNLEEERQRELKADKQYQSKLRSNAARRASLSKSWNEVEGQVRTRWKRILKGLSVALSRYEFLSELDKRDRDVLKYFATYFGEHVIIQNDRVVKYDWEMLQFVKIDVVNHVVESILTGQTVNRLRL